MTTKKYREGLICSINGLEYWHTGATYWLSHSESSDNQFDLRDMPGFKELASEFDAEARIFHSERWRIAAQAESALQSHLEGLAEHRETLWWELVKDYLLTYQELKAEWDDVRRRLTAMDISWDILEQMEPGAAMAEVLVRRVKHRLAARDTHEDFEPPEE